tara:strand:- start:2584 stop:3057 length:474 start_codon:yes stop_codon:yes gene_type:complete
VSKLITTPLKFLFKKGLKLTGLGLTVKELNDYRKKMIDEGKDPLSPSNFINEYGKPLFNKVKKIGDAFTDNQKADGGMMEMRKKNMGLKMANGGPVGSGLKPVPADNKGLSKLPTPVRNKMGFMKDGGMVKKRAKSKSKKSRGMGVAKRGGKFKGTF